MEPFFDEIEERRNHQLQAENAQIATAKDTAEIKGRLARTLFGIITTTKAALIACGIIPLQREESLQEILTRLGSGIYLSTQVVGIPKGSVLGTSSILSAACVKAIYEMFGPSTDNDQVSQVVLCMEQIMSTGGGWQDQVGGLTDGVKFIRFRASIQQELQIEYVNISPETQQEFQECFALVYTGQSKGRKRSGCGGASWNKNSKRISLPWVSKRQWAPGSCGHNVVKV